MNAHLSPPLFLTYSHRIPHRSSDTFVFLHSSSEPIAIVSNTSPIPTHIHNTSRPLFLILPFCFISNRILFVIASSYTFLTPLLRHLFLVSVSTNSPLFAYNVGPFLGFVPHILALLPCPSYASGVLYVFIRLVHVASFSVGKVSEYYECLYCILTFLPPLKSYPTTRLLPFSTRCAL